MESRKGCPAPGAMLVIGVDKLNGKAMSAIFGSRFEVDENHQVEVESRFYDYGYVFGDG